MKFIAVKFSVVILLVALLATSFPAKPVHAQFVVEFGPTATTLISGILTSTTTTAVATTGTALVSGIPGIGAATVNSARAALGGTCLATITALQASDAVDSFLDAAASTTLSVIGGSPFEFTKVNAKLAKATAAKVCVDTYVEALSAIPGVTFEISNEVQREQDKYTKISNSLRQQIQDLGAQQNASAKDIMKAFMVKLVLNLNKNLTTKVVNNLLQEYKIDDYLAYGDALATQVYAMKYIDQNYKGDARTQMMMRSLIQSEKVPGKARVAAAFANQQAKEYITNACGSVGQLDAQDQSSLNCLAAYGNEQSSPMFKYLNALDTSSKIQTEAKKTAQAEIAQSNGYAPPRDCSGSLADQQRIDASSDQAANEVVIAANILAQLQEALLSGKTTQAEVDKAQAAFDAADKKMSDLVSKDVESPVIDICKAIDSPASYVGNSIQKFLDQHIDQGSKLESENLPFFATFLADLTGNFLTNLLTGGKKSSKIFKEAGVAALGAGIASVPTLIGNSGSGTSNEFGNPWVTVYMTRVGSSSKLSELTPGQQYTFNVDISGHIRDGRTAPNRITIRDRDTGQVINNGQTSVSAIPSSNLLQYNFTAQNRLVKWEVELAVREGDGARILDTVTGAYFVPGADGTVSGVSTTNFNPRGSIVATFRPR